jgi:hypothetical protein
MAAHMLAITCVVALALPAAGGARVMDSTRTTISVHQDANTTIPSNATTLGHTVENVPCSIWPPLIHNTATCAVHHIDHYPLHNVVKASTILR